MLRVGQVSKLGFSFINLKKINKFINYVLIKLVFPRVLLPNINTKIDKDKIIKIYLT